MKSKRVRITGVLCCRDSVYQITEDILGCLGHSDREVNEMMLVLEKKHSRSIKKDFMDRDFYILSDSGKGYRLTIGAEREVLGFINDAELRLLMRSGRSDIRVSFETLDRKVKRFRYAANVVRILE